MDTKSADLTGVRVWQEKRELAKRFSDRTGFESYVPREEEGEALAAEGKASNLEPASTHVTLSKFMPTSRRIVQFSDGIPAPPNASIVYIDGAFDMFHPGHIEILKVRPPSGFSGTRTSQQDTRSLTYP